MPAGLNLSGNFIRLLYMNRDDDVGGANPTGTILHESIMGRIDEDMADSGFYQQGLETIKTFSAMFWGHNLTFREQDEFTVTSPPNHRYYNKTFRVLWAGVDSNHPGQKRDVYLAKLKRSQIAHKNQFM